MGPRSCFCSSGGWAGSSQGRQEAVGRWATAWASVYMQAGLPTPTTAWSVLFLSPSEQQLLRGRPASHASCPPAVFLPWMGRCACVESTSSRPSPRPEVSFSEQFICPCPQLVNAIPAGQWNSQEAPLGGGKPLCGHEVPGLTTKANTARSFPQASGLYFLSGSVGAVSHIPT